MLRGVLLLDCPYGSIRSLAMTVGHYLCNSINILCQSRMHARLITCLQTVLEEARVPTSVTLTEARGLRGDEDKTRPGDIVVLDYHAPERHLLLDGVVTTAYHEAEGD